jgi:hypothetical protein
VFGAGIVQSFAAHQYKPITIDVEYRAITQDVSRSKNIPITHVSNQIEPCAFSLIFRELGPPGVKQNKPCWLGKFVVFLWGNNNAIRKSINPNLASIRFDRIRKLSVGRDHPLIDVFREDSWGSAKVETVSGGDRMAKYSLGRSQQDRSSQL